MLAHYRQLPLPDLATGIRMAAQARNEAGRARRIALLLGALGFLAFMPYPAINAGNATAIQSGNLLTLLLVIPLLFAANSSRIFRVYVLLLIPLCITCVKTAISGNGDLDLSLKVLAVAGITLLIMPIIQAHGARCALPMMTGIAIATILHAAVGLWQMHGFASGYFPLTELYINNSFLSVKENATIIHRYIQRPFGLFPEPSAMSSSLAPWVLLWIASLCNIIRLRQQPARWQRALFGIAAAGGLALIILSRSGHAAVTLAAALLFVGIWLIRARATPQSSIALFLVFGLLLPLVLWGAAVSLGDRVGDPSAVGNSSWEERSSSLVIGLELLLGRDVGTLLFGFGAGHTSPILMEHAGLEAVWSVVLTYVYETGLVGVFFLTCVALMVYRAWSQSGHSLVFASIAGVWFVGVLITTSYSQLLPLWIAMAYLLIWPQVVGQPTGQTRTVRIKRPQARRVRPVSAVKSNTSWRQADARSAAGAREVAQ